MCLGLFRPQPRSYPSCHLRTSVSLNLWFNSFSCCQSLMLPKQVYQRLQFLQSSTKDSCTYYLFKLKNWILLNTISLSHPVSHVPPDHMGLGPPRTFMNFNASLLICVSSGELSKQQRLLQWYASFCVINFRAPLTTVGLLCACIGEAANELPRRDSLTAQTGALFEELWYSISHQWQTLFLCQKNNDNRTDFMAGLLRSKWPREFQWNETKEMAHLCSSCKIRSLVAVMEFCLKQ